MIRVFLCLCGAFVVTLLCGLFAHSWAEHYLIQGWLTNGMALGLVAVLVFWKIVK